MTQVLSKVVPSFDISSTSFRAAARDLGEVLALLAGGVKPDPDSISRLCLSLRLLQGFLLDEAEQQDAREVLANAVAAIDPRSMAMIPVATDLVVINADQPIRVAS